MAARVIKLGNLLPVIENCLGEHQVDLRDDTGKKQSFYLIETRTMGNRASDFESTYDGFEDLTPFHLELADKTWGSRRGPHEPQVYGTLIDTSLQYSFAFNRRFADLSENKDRLEFMTPDQVFLDDTGYEESQGPQIIIPVEENEEPTHFDSFQDMQIRYSLQGAKRRKFSGPISFERNSLLGRVKDCIALGPMVEMPQMPQTSGAYSLLKVDYETPTLNDLLMTYPEGLSRFQLELAEKTLGGKTANNSYFILIDDQLRMRFAANELFTNHDPRNGEITFLSPEDALLQFGKDLSEKPADPVPPKKPVRRRPGRRPMTFRYSLAGKKQD